MAQDDPPAAPVAGSFRRIALRSHNRLLEDYRMQVFGKTGWTRAAKKCFVGAGRAGGREIGFAVLGSTDLWGDVKRLLEYGFGTGSAPEPAAPEFEVALAGTNSAVDDDDDGVTNAHPAQKYFVSLGSFRTRRSATRLRTSLVRAGYHTGVQKIRHGRQPLYRVLVGGYPSRREAEQAAAKLRSKQQPAPTLVLASR